MDEQWYKPIWIKVVLGFTFLMTGILLTFLMFRFFPVPHEAGVNGLGAIKKILLGLVICLLLYIGGVIAQRNYPYVIFFLCLMIFFGFLVITRYLAA